MPCLWRLCVHRCPHGVERIPLGWMGSTKVVDCKVREGVGVGWGGRDQLFLHLSCLDSPPLWLDALSYFRFYAQTSSNVSWKEKLLNRGRKLPCLASPCLDFLLRWYNKISNDYISLNGKKTSEKRWQKRCKKTQRQIFDRSTWVSLQKVDFNGKKKKYGRFLLADFEENLHILVVWFSPTCRIFKFFIGLA